MLKFTAGASWFSQTQSAWIGFGKELVSCSIFLVTSELLQPGREADYSHSCTVNVNSREEPDLHTLPHFVTA